MRILLLSDINSPHTQRWANALAEGRHIIGIFSISEPTNNWYKDIPQIELLSKSGFNKGIFSKSIFHKLYFLKALQPLKKAIKKFKPDIVHAHYASSYGLLGALSVMKTPLVISAWGSDIYYFPNINFITKNILHYSLNKANCITATSKHLAEATKLFTKTRVEVVPFGIDTEKFFSNKQSIKEDKQIVIGAVKSLEKIYGIDTLIKAFKKCKNTLPKFNLKLRLVGEGSEKNKLVQLTKDLQIEKDVEFVGKIEYGKVAEEYSKLDIFANLSVFESFGVSVLEASSCELPVVLSDVGGLKEVGIKNNTCLFVPPGDIEAVARAFQDLIVDSEKRRQFGKEGRQFVIEKYSLGVSAEKMMTIYKTLLK